MTINGNIKHIIEKRNIKCWKLAKEIEVDPSNLYSILRGEVKNPTINTLIKIADYLNISLDELVGRYEKF